MRRGKDKNAIAGNGENNMPIDYGRYPVNWKSEIVPRIIQRADECCEFCNVVNGSSLWSVPIRVRHDGRYKIKRIWLTENSDKRRMETISEGGDIKKIKVVLTVAHLDHDEENHDVLDNRLAALCQWCHLNYDAKEKYRRACSK